MKWNYKQYVGKSLHRAPLVEFHLPMMFIIRIRIDYLGGGWYRSTVYGKVFE